MPMRRYLVLQATIALPPESDVEALTERARALFDGRELGFVVRRAALVSSTAASAAEAAAEREDPTSHTHTSIPAATAGEVLEDPGAVNPDERARLAEAIAILANAVAGVGDPSVVSDRRLMLPALGHAGRALVLLGEAAAGEDLKTACARLIERHNARTRDASRPSGALPPTDPEDP